MLSDCQISQQALINNILFFRKKLHPKSKIVAVIKANAYGHGQNEVAQILEPYADYFAVDDLEELKLLRQVSTKPCLVLGYVEKKSLPEALRLNPILGIYDLERLKIINQLAQGLKTRPVVYLKIDAGLGRQGILLPELEQFLKQAKKYSQINLEGLYAHFANIEDTTDFSHAQKQIDLYQKACRLFQKTFAKKPLTHISSTAGTLVYEKNLGKSNLVRLGIGLYGMWPSVDVQNRSETKKDSLIPVLKWVTHIAQVKTVPANFTIGYGLTFITKKPTKIAVIPQGYSDGYDRGLSNCGTVLINEKFCPVLGRIAMNMFVVDVSHLQEVKVEDEVVLLGKQGKNQISAEEIAAKLGTINYEITTRISPLLKRIIIK